MASQSALLGVIVLLITLPHALTYPISQISAPEVGALSFTELAQETFRRVLELGFVRGVLVSLLVLGCIVCLLICLLSILAAYLRRNETRRWNQSEQNSEQEKVQLYSLTEVLEKDAKEQQCQPRNGVARYILGYQSSPMPNISIHALFPRRMTTTLPPQPPSSPQDSRTTRPPRSPSTNLRSALSRSPAPRRFSRAQLLLFGRRRSSPATSPKSVRWADELQVALAVRAETSGEPEDAGFEADIGLGRAEGVDLEVPSTPPTAQARDIFHPVPLASG